LTVGVQDAEAVAKDEVQRVLQMTEVRRRQWEKTWEQQRARLEQNLQMCQFFFDLRQVCGMFSAAMCKIVLKYMNRVV